MYKLVVMEQENGTYQIETGIGLEISGVKYVTPNTLIDLAREGIDVCVLRAGNAEPVSISRFN